MKGACYFFARPLTSTTCLVHVSKLRVQKKMFATYIYRIWLLAHVAGFFFRCSERLLTPRPPGLGTKLIQKAPILMICG